MEDNKITLKVERNSRVYELQLSNDSPLGELFDVLTDMRAYVLNHINEVSKNESSKEIIVTDEIPKEVVNG